MASLPFFTNSGLCNDDSLKQTHNILSASDQQEQFQRVWSAAANTPPLQDCGSCDCTDSNCVGAGAPPRRFTGLSKVGIPDTTALRNAPVLSQLMGIPPPPPLKRVNAYTTADLSSDMSPAARFLPSPTVTEAEVANTLRTYRVQLHIERQQLFGNVNTQEELNAADRRYDLITRKINAIESTMLAMGAIFRTF